MPEKEAGTENVNGKCLRRFDTRIAESPEPRRDRRMAVKYS
jgi:hypothetical protein